MKLLHERDDFSDLINVANSATHIPESFIIKDYWVTEILRTIQTSPLNGHVIFKGGTSLSKAYGIINRFSEDIDLLFTDCEIGKNQRRKQMKLAESLALALPGLVFDKENADNFSSDDHKTSCLIYAAQPTSEVLPYIRMEMGFRGGTEPFKTRMIQSTIAAFIEKQNPHAAKEFSNLSAFPMNVLDPFRTLIEKIFSLHRSFHDGRLQDKERHFYDIYFLLKLDGIADRLGTPEHFEIKKNVAHFDQQFNNKHIPADLKFGPSPIFTTDHRQFDETKHAYENSQIYYGTRPDFNEMIAFIASYREKL
ncbi:nucleotidyl transferase AbiEii/AbiGii toxin family protein [Bdellovibrionota bacterium FG-2]